MFGGLSSGVRRLGWRLLLTATEGLSLYVSGPRAYEGRPDPRHDDKQVIQQSSIAAGRGHGRMKAGIFRARFAHGAMSADAAAGEGVARSQKLSGGPPSRAGESRGNRTSPFGVIAADARFRDEAAPRAGRDTCQR